MRPSSKALVKGLLRLSILANVPWLAGRVLAGLPRALPIGAAAPLAGSPRILVLNAGKSEFVRDLDEIFRHNDAFQLVGWPQYVLDTLVRASFRRKIKHDRYLTGDPATEANKPRLRRFLASMWVEQQKRQPVVAVISPNFGYFPQREFAAALEMTGTPFLVMQKENLNASTPERREIWKKIYTHGRGTFGGRKILVYNQMERDLQVESGIVSQDQVEVVGMPRLDLLHRWRRVHAGSREGAAQVLFFAFSRFDKIPHATGFTKNWGQFCTDTHRAIVACARSNPNIAVVAKTKGLTRQDDELLTLVGAEAGGRPSNLRVVSGGDSFELTAESRVVVGFNTSGLIEALALGKPVVVPRFGEALDPELSKLVLDLGDAVTYADSPAHLQELVAECARRPDTIPAELSPKVTQILTYWVGNDDGEAGRRAYQAIRSEVLGS